MPLRAITFTRYPPLELGQELGSYAAEGLDLSVEVTPSSLAQMQGLTNGRWDIAVTAFDNLLASVDREGVRSVALAGVSRLNLSLWARREIQSWADLHGKPVAADAPNTAFALVLRRILLEHDLDLDAGDYQLLGVGGNPERLASMEAGETYAGMFTTPGDEAAARAGMHKLADYQDVLPDYPGNVLAVAQPWLDQPVNRDAAVRFLRAWLRTVEWGCNPANRDEAIAIMARRLEVSVAAAATLVDGILTDSAPNPASFQVVLDLRVGFGFVPPPGPPIERFYDASVYRDVLLGHGG